MSKSEQPETDNLARMWLEAGDRAMRDGLPAKALMFRNMAYFAEREIEEAEKLQLREKRRAHAPTDRTHAG